MFLSLLFTLTLFGYIQPDNRIIGGNYAKKGQFPYQISLQLNGRHYCGGSIISPTAIITAAHCTIEQNPSALTVIAGTTDLQLKDGISVNVAKLINHPQYSRQVNDYDVALIVLSQPLQLSDSIKAIALSDPQENFEADTIAIISGWGAINQNLDLTNKLKYANVQLWSREYCNAQNIPGITDRMICAGHPSGQVSACQGDSGGPLTVNNKLVGVVSWGFGCGAVGPAMYTFVGSVRPWIKSSVGV